MAKNLFRAGEVINTEKKVYIKAPELYVPQALEVEEVEEEYTGPTADDLRREAELFKEQWEAEKLAMIESAKAEADKIVKEAEAVAFEEVKKRNEEAARIKEDSEAQADKLISEAESRVDELISTAERKAGEVETLAYEKGLAEGKEEGFRKGQEESERLITRLHDIINKAIEKRNDILEDTEGQLVQLVLQISKKVIKVISENQKNIVINNIVQALQKLKTKVDVVIRVNLRDLKMTTEHTKEILEMAENAKSIRVFEDTSVDPGGCIIETDIGKIDARITSQLQEIEDRILELSPIKETL